MSFLGRKKSGDLSTIEQPHQQQPESTPHPSTEQPPGENEPPLAVARTVSAPDLSKYDKVETQNTRVCALF